MITEQYLQEYNKWLMEVWNPNQLYIPFAIDAPKAFLDHRSKVKNLSSNTLLAVRCPLVEIDREVLQMCVEMYQKGERLTAIRWLIEEAKRTEYTFGIKWAHEYFQSIGLEAVEGNDR